MKYLYALILGFICLGMFVIANPVTKYPIPEGKLCWASTKPTHAKMCVPAAFTDQYGNVLGSYKVNNKTRNKSTMNMKVSLKEDTFYISRNWMSDNGFQQLTLVCDSKPMRFRSTDRSIRRALCKDNDHIFILQSKYPMTLTSFASYCSKYSTNATYLDMGKYGYGYTSIYGIKVPLFICGIFTKHKQTNWLYIE